MDSENMQFLLSRVTEFDDMKYKRFGLKKCNTISPRILALQKSLGFAPGEPINAKNIHRIIPATKNIDLILNRNRRSMTPMQKIQPGKDYDSNDNEEGKVSLSQNRFRPGSSNISGVTSHVHTPNTTNGVNHRFSTQSSKKSSVQKICASHDVVGAILKRASTTTLSSRFSTPTTAKSSIAKDEVHLSKNPDGHPTSSQESGISVSTEDSETFEEKENKISDLIF